jgi:hypothetical protein
LVAGHNRPGKALAQAQSQQSEYKEIENQARFSILILPNDPLRIVYQMVVSGPGSKVAFARVVFFSAALR